VDKAVQLANKFDCDILLLHIEESPVIIPFLYNAFTWGSKAWSAREDPAVKMKELESQFKPKLKAGLLMTSASFTGNWQYALKDIIITEHIDLVLIPRSKKRLSSAVIRRININKLSQETNCPIMTITRNFNANYLQRVVVPINNLIPVKKLKMATYISLETSGCIYLMGNINQSITETEKGYLMKAYQLLNDFGKLKIQFALQGNEDTGDSTLAFAKHIRADLIVVNPGNESRIRGFWNKLRGNYLFRESDIPVMTVAF
jgi:hypothetical protein